MTYKFTDSTNRVVVSQSGESFLASLLDAVALAQVLAADIPTLVEAKATANTTIDAAAESIRLKYCSSPLLADEYKLAYDDACTWLLNQVNPVPKTVQDWANINAWAALQAATNIKAAGDGMNAKLIQIRASRLTWKSSVNKAVDNAAVTVALSSAIAALGLL